MLTAPAPVGSPAQAQVPSAAPDGRVGISIVGTLLTATAVLAWSAGPIIDPDVFWHVRVGGELLHHGRVPTPDPWAYTLPTHHWHSGAWLTEIVYYLLHHLGGYPAIVCLRFVTTALLLCCLAVQLHRRARPAIATVCFLLACFPLLGYIQDRPQLFSLLFTVWLAGWLQDARGKHRLPGVAMVVVMTWAWAMVHGLWLLVPALFVLVAAVSLADDGRRGLPFARGCVVRAAAAVAAAALTPVGPALLATPFTLWQSTRNVYEWMPTSIHDPQAWGVVSLVAVVVWCWSRVSSRVGRSEVLYVAAVVLFGMWAIRNAGIAALLLAPVAADRVMAARADVLPRRAPLVVPGAFVPVLATLGLVVSAALYAGEPVIRQSLPSELTQQLASQPGTLRVLDDYNVSGYLIDRATPHVRVAIDGRSDRYGGAYIARYMDMISMLGDWRDEVRSLRPDVALLDTRTSPLPDGLVSEAHWRVAGREGSWVLLTAPGVTLR